MKNLLVLFCISFPISYGTVKNGTVKKCEKFSLSKVEIDKINIPEGKKIYKNSLYKEKNPLVQANSSRIEKTMDLIFEKDRELKYTIPGIYNRDAEYYDFKPSNDKEYLDFSDLISTGKPIDEKILYFSNLMGMEDGILLLLKSSEEAYSFNIENSKIIGRESMIIPHKTFELKKNKAILEETPTPDNLNTDSFVPKNKKSSNNYFDNPNIQGNNSNKDKIPFNTNNLEKSGCYDKYGNPLHGNDVIQALGETMVVYSEKEGVAYNVRNENTVAKRNEEKNKAILKETPTAHNLNTDSFVPKNRKSSNNYFDNPNIQGNNSNKGKIHFNTNNLEKSGCYDKYGNPLHGNDVIQALGETMVVYSEKEGVAYNVRNENTVAKRNEEKNKAILKETPTAHNLNTDSFVPKNRKSSNNYFDNPNIQGNNSNKDKIPFNTNNLEKSGCYKPNGDKASKKEIQSGKLFYTFSKSNNLLIPVKKAEDYNFDFQKACFDSKGEIATLEEKRTTSKEFTTVLPCGRNIKFKNKDIEMKEKLDKIVAFLLIPIP